MFDRYRRVLSTRIMGKAILVCGFGSLLLIAACAPSVEQIGPRMFSIERCKSAGACFKAANQVCPDGFDVRDSSSHTTMAVASGNAVFVGHQSELVVECQGRVSAPPVPTPPSAQAAPRNWSQQKPQVKSLIGGDNPFDRQH